MRFHTYLRGGIVYVPTVGLQEGGPVYVEIEPVAVIPAANSEALRHALLEASEKKVVLVPVPKGKWPPPVLLKYAGVKTWSAFARSASTWNASEKDGLYKIVGYRKHAKGYWVEDNAQRIQFPTGTVIDAVVDRMIAILQDAAHR